MDEGISLFDLIKIILKNWLMLLGFLILGIIIGICFSKFIMKEKYQSQASIMVAISYDGEPKEYDYNNSLLLINTVSELAKQGIVLESVAIENNLTIEDLMAMLKVESSSSSLLIKIICENEDKYLAQKLADEVADALIFECKTNSDLGMIGSSLLRTSNAIEGVYIGQNKALVALFITCAITFMGICCIFLKEWLISKRKSLSKINILNQLENI